MTTRKHKPKRPKMAMSAARVKEVRTLLKDGGDPGAEVAVWLAANIFLGDINVICAKLIGKAARSGIKGDWKIIHRSERYRGKLFYMVGYRPYTDEEINAKSVALLKRMEARKTREAKVRRVKIDKLNDLAAELGIEVDAS